MGWRHLTLAGCLAAFWIALSGHVSPLLLAVGALSVALGVAVAARARVVDKEGMPVELIAGTLTYYPWLVGEIVKSAVTVTKAVLSPRLPISPTMTVVAASQKSRAGVATYANSITLTPGTITVGVRGNRLTVHALQREGALDLEAGGMDRRVTRFEGRT